MFVHPAGRGVVLLVFSWFLLCGSLPAVLAQDELPPEIDSDGVQTLTRGPVHEAFASPTIADPKPGLVVPKAPPADIKEQPPEYQPDGQNVQWFPGYWAWDEDRDDYIWISGAWRDPPPGRRWVPGYWAEVEGGFQWIAGFWIAEQTEEMEYHKPPPASLEQGPTTASPGDDYFYIPGNWVSVNNDYQWSPGYWAPYREDWVYVQPHWVWTPSGCVFIPGYYDWRLPRRGQIFAPIYVTPVVYSRPTYYYTPRCVINTSNLFVHLWVRDSYSHYYFGNYYGPTYVNRQFTPWCNYNSRPHCYDPLFTYCNVHYHRQGINYAQRMQGWHNHYVNHVNERPANTWRDQLALHTGGGDHHREYRAGDRRPATLGEDLKDIVRTPEYRWKKQDLVAKDHNKAAIEQVKELHNLRIHEEKANLVSRDVPGRDLPGRDLPGRNDDGRPNRGPNLGDPSKGPDLKLPGKKPIDNPADKIAATQQALTGKIRLPKVPDTSHLTANKPKIEVPKQPERLSVSRPTDRNPLDRNPIDRNPGDRTNPLDKPLTNTGKPNLGGDNPSRLPGVRIPGANPGSNPGANLGPSLDGPRNTNVPHLNPLDKKPLDTKPLTTREPKVPNLGGNTSAGKPSTGNTSAGNAASSAQQRIEALRKQQQDLLNNARNRKTEPAPNLGGNPTRSLETPKVNTTPKVDLMPKVDRTPKIELPKREVTRPPLSSGGSNPPRNFGGNSGGINLGGNTKPNVQPSQPSRSNAIQQLQPRNSPVPRSNPSNGSGNSEKDKKRGR